MPAPGTPLASGSVELPGRVAPPASGDTVWMFPGLGSRYVGMGADLIGREPAADRLIRSASKWLGYNVAEVCLEGSGRKYVSPRHEAQTLYVLACAYAAALIGRGLRPARMAGHSLGTFAAAFAAGAYDFLTGLQLVTRLEDLMEEMIDSPRSARLESSSDIRADFDLPVYPQAMAAIIGLSEEQVEALCRARVATYLANQNSKGQYVIAGHAAEVDRALAEANQIGAYKVKRLPTSRAMHTPLLAAVARRFADCLETVTLNRPKTPFLNLETADIVGTADGLRRYLAHFVCQPVRWESAVRSLLEQGMRSFVEVGPATVLTELMYFIDRSAQARPASEVLREVPP